MARQAIIPTSIHNPTGQDGRIARCEKDFKRRLNASTRIYNEFVKELDYTIVQLNSSSSYFLNKDNFYKYSINPQQLALANEQMAGRVAQLFMVDEDGFIVRKDNARRLWLMSGYVEPAYAQGTTATAISLANQSVVYASAVQSPQDIFLSQAYADRVGFLAARQFELMESFTSDVIKEAQLVLSDGIRYGESPRTIAKGLRERIGIKQSRANTIARTEINNAHRQANRDESRRADEDFGVKTKQLWIASMLPNMRPTHLSRSGNLHTAKEDEAFYAKNANAIGCRCAQSAIVVDENGNPLNEGPIKKVRKVKADFGG